MKKKKKLLLNEDKGFVELHFSVDEVINLLEILAFSRKLCNSLVANPPESMSDDTKYMLQDKMLSASLLEEKIRADVDPGRPEGPLH
jgi:hypothetical protein